MIYPSRKGKEEPPGNSEVSGCPPSAGLGRKAGSTSLVSSGQDAAAQCLRDRSAFAESCMSRTFQKVRELDLHREQLILPSPPKSKVSSEYHLNQPRARVKVQFIARQNSSSVMKPDKSCASKIQLQDRHRIGIYSHSKREKLGKKKKKVVT